MRYLTALLLLLCVSPLSLAAKKPKAEVLVNFSGVLKRVTKGQIAIEPDPDNQMVFIRTKRTKFISGGRPVDGSALPSGIVVNIQGFERLNRELEAVTLTVALPDQSPIK